MMVWDAAPLLCTAVACVVLLAVLVRLRCAGAGCLPAYVISMRGDPRRPRDAATRRFAQQPFTFVDAVDGRTMADASLFDSSTHRWLPGEMGCAMTHMCLWQQLTGPALIFEDDAQLPPRWRDELAAVLRAIQHDDALDVVFLGHCAEKAGAPFHGNLRASVSPRCTHAYLVTRRGMQRLAAWATGARLSLPIDEELARLCQAGKLRCLSHWPALVQTTGDCSTIR